MRAARSALVCLALFVRRRAQGRPMTGAMWALVVIGIAALVLKALFWHLEFVEALLVGLAVVAIGVWTRRQQRRV